MKELQREIVTTTTTTKSKTTKKQQCIETIKDLCHFIVGKWRVSGLNQFKNKNEAIMKPKKINCRMQAIFDGRPIKKRENKIEDRTMIKFY